MSAPLRFSVTLLFMWVLYIMMTEAEVVEDSILNNTIRFIQKYQNELQALLLQDEDEFLRFKEYNSKRPMTWMVMFATGEFQDYSHIGEVLDTRYPHLLDIFYREQPFVSAVGGGTGLTDVRYLYDVAVLERIFHLPPGGDSNQQGISTVLEIGGGYGGFAHTFSAAHDVTAYHIVDMAPSLAFQERYLSLLRKKGSSVQVPFVPISEESTDAVASDLFYSFLAMDEVPEDTFLRYVDQYVSHAKRGYILLAASRVRMFKVFQSVWAVQPTAVMLPPDVGYSNFGATNELGHGISVRIVWDNSNSNSADVFSSHYTWLQRGN